MLHLKYLVLIFTYLSAGCLKVLAKSVIFTNLHNGAKMHFKSFLLECVDKKIVIKLNPN